MLIKDLSIIRSIVDFGRKSIGDKIKCGFK